MKILTEGDSALHHAAEEYQRTLTKKDSALRHAAEEYLRTLAKVNAQKTRLDQYVPEPWSSTSTGIMLALHLHGPTNMASLARLVGVLPQTLTAMIDKLVDRGLVERTRYPRDRRQICIQATDAGLQGEALILEAIASFSAPKIVCLCGSTKFIDVFRETELKETLAGNIVLTIGCDTKSDDMLNLPEGTKQRLDALHKRKIDLADEILIVSDETGYFGESTTSELRYARDLNKPVRFLNGAVGQLAAQKLAQ